MSEISQVSGNLGEPNQVLAVTAAARRNVMPIFKKILSPIDFSEPSQAALETASALASSLGAELLLVHIVPAISDLPSDVSVLKEGEYDEALHKDAENRLAQMAQKLSLDGIKATSATGTANDTAMEIIRVGEENGVDLIVIATHGMTGLRKLVFGSVTAKIVNEAKCPVLIMHQKKT